MNVIIRKKRRPLRRVVESIIIGLLWLSILFVLTTMALFLLRISSDNLTTIYVLLKLSTEELQQCLNAFTWFLSLMIIISLFVHVYHGMEEEDRDANS